MRNAHTFFSSSFSTLYSLLSLFLWFASSGVADAAASIENVKAEDILPLIGQWFAYGYHNNHYYFIYTHKKESHAHSHVERIWSPRIEIENFGRNFYIDGF